MLSPDTIEIQTKLGTYCRTGIMPELPGVNKKHIKHYRRLIFNVVSNNIKQAFPIARKVTGPAMFREMIQEFFIYHDAQTSQIWKLPGEFYQYAIKSSWTDKYKLPWLNDLLLFEWTELKVFTMPDGIIPEHSTDGDFLADKLVLNPDFEIIQLSYPIHMHAIREAEEKKNNYYILIFRKRESGQVRFINLSVFFVYLLQRIMTDALSLKEILQKAFAAFHLKDEKKYSDVTGRFFKDLQKQGFFLGYQRYS